MAPFVDGPARSRHRRDRDRPARSARPRTRSRRSTSPSRRRPTSRSAAIRSAAGSRAWPRPSPTRPTPRWCCSATRSTRPARRSGPTRGSPTGRPSAARSCCCRASPTRSPGSTCCAPPSRGWRDGELVTYPRLGHTLKPVLEDVLDRVAAFLRGGCATTLNRMHRLARSAGVVRVVSRRAPAYPDRSPKAGATPGRPVPPHRSSPDDARSDPQAAHDPLATATRPTFGALTASSRQEGAPLRVLSGRLKAVFVAPLAAIICSSASSRRRPRSRATRPVSARFMYALGRVESGGSYTARNPLSGAYGKYQIMPVELARPGRGRTSVIRTRDRRRPTRRSSRRPSSARCTAGSQSWRRVAYWWLTGSSRTTRLVDLRDALRDQGHGLLRQARLRRISPGRPPRPPRAAVQRPPPLLGDGARRSPTPAMAPASVRGYAGGAVRYATTAGRKATFTFTGQRVTWYGPVGPTRGKARVFVDGSAGQDGRPHRSSFAAPRRCSAGRGPRPASTRSTIEVVGTRQPPVRRHRRVRRQCQA